ncbi:MAG: SDR family oxidoreductase [Pseudomonadota bacterium]
MATYVVTGCNRGIGLELCRQLTQREDRVIAVCRHASQALVDLGVEAIESIDVADEGAMASLADALAGIEVDVLINNAGILTRESLDSLDFERMRQQFEVNTLGPLRVTHTLLEHLREGSKVAIVTSRMGSVADNTSGGYYGYRMSKAAVNMAGVSLARDLEPRGIAVGLFHPGMVATEMTGYQGIAPEEAASGLIARIDALGLASTGTFWHANGEPLPW